MRLELDKIPLWRGDHVSIKQLIADFGSYLYLQRPRDPEVLVNAIREGISFTTWQTETFAFAESWDEKSGRYLGLRANRVVNLTADGPGLLVKADRAMAQLAQDELAKPGIVSAVVSMPGGTSLPAGTPKSAVGSTVATAPTIEKPHHF